MAFSKNFSEAMSLPKDYSDYVFSRKDETSEKNKSGECDAKTSKPNEANTEDSNGAVTSEEERTKQQPKEKKPRCDKCGKKLGITNGYNCRCGKTFCAVHRYSDRHECSFNYRELGASEIERNNPQIVATKLEKL